MVLYVSKRMVASAVDDVVVPFACHQCHRTSIADVITLAVGVSEAPFLIGQETARTAAAEDAVAGIRPLAEAMTRALGCPYCGYRSPADRRRAVLRAGLAGLLSWGGVLGLVIAVLLVSIALAVQELATKTMFFGYAIAALSVPVSVMGWLAHRRFLRDAEAAVTWRLHGEP